LNGRNSKTTYTELGVCHGALDTGRMIRECEVRGYHHGLEGTKSPSSWNRIYDSNFYCV